MAGSNPARSLAGHLGVITGAAVLTSGVSLAVSALFFSRRIWVEYAGADVLIALTYAMPAAPGACCLTGHSPPASNS